MTVYRLRTKTGELKALLSTSTALLVITDTPGRWEELPDGSQGFFINRNRDGSNNPYSLYVGSSITGFDPDLDGIAVTLWDGDVLCVDKE